MSIRYQNTGEPRGTKKSEEHQAGEGHDENCRCKEASAMTPRELLTLMVKDLAFWKKGKK